MGPREAARKAGLPLRTRILGRFATPTPLPDSMKPEGDKESNFLDLVDRVRACQKCPRMNGSARVLGPGCGPLDAPLMFVGEAPGRLGADGSHLPFHGDKSGHNFEKLIEQVGVSRYEVFVTNAVLCSDSSVRALGARRHVPQWHCTPSVPRHLV